MGTVSLTLSEDMARELMIFLVEKMIRDGISPRAGHPLYQRLRSVVGGRTYSDIASTTALQEWNRLSPREREIVVFCEAWDQLSPRERETLVACQTVGMPISWGRRIKRILEHLPHVRTQGL